MAEEGSERENGGLVAMDSMESRWVFQDEDETEMEDDDEDLGLRTALDSEDDENGEPKLIRTGPRIDSFDVEALEIPGAQRNDYEDFSLGRRIILAFQTLGVVFGDVGTSPLYTFGVMFSKAPIKGDEDIIGGLSLILYTLILIPLIKYVLVVLWANDDGEGGTFALYSLICRHAKVSLLPNQLPSDARISSFRLKVPSPELERSLKIKERLETSLTLKKLLLMLVLAGTAMVIADGVVTPAMSVMSAVGGLKVGISGIKQDEVVMIAVAFLIILFSVQKFGTSKVGLAVGPALFIWFCSLAGIGIYNLVKYDSRVLMAFNPVHIYYFFKRNSTKAWYALGGCLLCATGSEAMFADLCYFPVRSVQLTFVFLVLPCLLLGYLGQAAYLMENHDQYGQLFFSSIPSGAFWPVFLIANIAALIASRAMTTATFSCVKQSTALGCFPRLKIIHTSRKFMGQIYIPVINWFLLVVCLVLVIFISNVNEIGNAYGRLLELKRPHLYWTPCAAHCLDLMLEDIGKLPNIKRTLERAISLNGYIYNRSGLLNMMRRFTGQRELLRPAKTRFATAFITLSRLHEQKNNLRKMFTSSDWSDSKWAKEQKGKTIANIVLMPSFWNTIVFCLKVSGPLVRVLRLVDGEKKAPMGYIYEAMNRAKDAIVRSFNGNEEKYKEIFNIIDKRWEIQLHRPLHAAGYFLNPEFFYDKPEIEHDADIMSDLYKCILRLTRDPAKQEKVVAEVSLFTNAQGLFGNELAVRTRKTRAPGIAEIGVMMMTTILVTIVMLLIWQINIIIVLSFLVVFLGVELTFFSSVLWSVGDGSWIILVFAIVMFFIMFIWNYGSKLKYETEVKQKLSMDLMRELGCNLGTIRAPGIGLLYNELVKGIPAIFGHFLTTLPAIHSMIIFVCIKYVPVPVVPQSERFLFRRVCPKSYHIFRCIARYGYKDVRKENHQTFEQLLIESLEKFIRREAQERSLESDGDGDTDSEDESSSGVLIAPNGSVYSLGVPLLAEYKGTRGPITEASTSEEVRPEPPSDPTVSDTEHSLERELSFIRKAKESGVVYLLGHGDIRAKKNSWFIKKLMINYFYAFLRKNCRRGIANLSVPHSHLMQVGMTYMV